MKKIQFFCTSCNSVYTIARHDAERLPSGVFVCKTCGKKIKLAFCPECGISYSIGFNRQLQGRYQLKCRRCGREFHILFETSIPQKAARVLPDGGQCALWGNDGVVCASHSQTVQKETRTSIPKERTSEPAFAEKLFSFEAARRYFISIFKIKKIMAAAAGVLALAVLLMASEWARSVLQRFEFITQNHFMLHILNFFEIFCFAIVIASVNVIIARLTEVSASEGEMSVKDLARFGIIRAIPILTGVAGIIIVFNMLVVLFNLIPAMSPILYSLFILPIYLLSIAIVLLSLIAFWFYPPLLASVENVRSSITGFINFLRNHHATLLVSTLLLSVSALVFAGLLLFFCRITASLALSLSEAFLGDELTKVIFPVSADVGDALNFMVIFSRISMMHHAVRELLFAHRIGGILLGTVMIFLSTVMYSVILSGIGTLSAWAYRGIVSGKFPDARKIRIFLFTLGLILVVMYLFKKVFLS